MRRIRHGAQQPLSRGYTGHFRFGGPMTVRVKFQQRNENRHESLSKPLCAKVLCVGGTPDYRPDSSSQFWELDFH